MDTPEDEANEALWNYLRSGELRRTRFVVGVPRPRSQAEALEMLSLVENRPDDPTGVYVNRAYMAVREVIFARYEGPTESLERLESTILGLGSRTLRRQVEEVRGQLARSERRWSEAAVHFAAALPADDTVLRLGWHGLIAHWNLLDSRAIAGDPPPLSDLRAAWEIYDRHGVDVLRDRGCISTAAVLAASGHRGLAERFVRYIIDHTPAGYWERLFERQTEELGLGLEQVESLGEPESLDALLAELRLLS